MTLNPKKVLLEIKSLKKQILDKKEKDLTKIHKNVLMLCEEVYSRKSDYREIDIKLVGNIIQIVLDLPEELKEKLKIDKIPSDEYVLDAKNKLKKDMLEILNKIEEKYLLKQKLM
jgi:hypothetical protein